MAFVIVFLVIIFCVIGYVFSAGLRYRDIPVLVFLSSFVFFLSRFNNLVHPTIGERPYVGISIYSVLALVVLLVFRAAVKRPFSKILFIPVPFLMVFFVASLVSGVVNGSMKGFFSATQVLVISLTPAMVAWALVELYPRRYCDSLAIRKLFIVTLGLITPVILVVSALMPDIFGDLLGWDNIRSDSDLGFVRGWSPLGSTIATGCLIVMAYGFALNEAVANKSLTHAFVAALASVSILFTASRSVLLAFLFFNLVYILAMGNRTKLFRMALMPLIGMGAIIGYAFANRAISFGRFLETNDFSLYIRASSLHAAAVQFMNNVFFGKGPGLLYTQIRNDWLEENGGGGLIRLMLVGDDWSAMEPHNLYLLLLAEHGLFATLGYVMALVVVFIVVVRAPILGDPIARSEKAVFVGIWLTTMLMFSTASWPLINQKFSVFFWLFLFSCLHWAYGRFAQKSRLVSGC